MATKEALVSEWLRGNAGTGYRLLPQEASDKPCVTTRVDKVLPSDGVNVGRGTVETSVPSESEQDIVQFMSRIFYSEEGRTNRVSVKVIRIGRLQGSCSVKCRIQDGSAKAGAKYHHHESRLRFHEGESVKSFEVELIDDDNFDATLDFHCHMEKPENCAIQGDMSVSKVLIFDNDLFPSSEFEPYLQNINYVEEGTLHTIGFKLLWAFIRFTFLHVPSIWWKSIVAIFLAQLGNAYYLMTIYLKVYLVDVCLNVKDESTMERLLVPGNRGLTAALLGLAWVMPNFILVAADHFEMSVLEMGFHIRQHLRVNLFRKYLNYTRHSRARVPIQDLKTSMMEDIPTLTRDGYLITFEILKKVCKVIFVAYYLLQKHPRSGIPLAIYPTLMLLWLGSRYKRRLWLLKKNGDGVSDTQGWLLHAEDSFELVNDYDSRNAIVGKFQKVLQDQRKLVMALKSFSFWSGIVIPWITVIATGFYIATAGKLVTEGELSLGSFLATINLYKDLGDRFLGICADFEALSEVIDPLSVLTVQFNLETDLPQRMAAHEEHERYMLQYLSENKPPSLQSVTESAYDSIPILMKDVVLRNRHNRDESRSTISATTPQGSLVYVSGKSGSGKTSLLSMITRDGLPETGQVLLPPHLRVVHVSSMPSFVKSMGLYANIVFGVHPSPDYTVYANPDRVGRILKRLSLHQSWLYDAILEESEDHVPHLSLEEEETEYEEDHYLGSHEEEEPEELPEEAPWYEKMSRSEAKRLHLARAFIANPEVMVLHNPLGDLDENLAQDVAQMLRDFVDHRGLELDDKAFPWHRRRRRTAFFSANDVFGEFKTLADVTCSLGDQSEVVSFETCAKTESKPGWWNCA